jgi:hypothetical protein
MRQAPLLDGLTVETVDPAFPEDFTRPDLSHPICDVSFFKTRCKTLCNTCLQPDGFPIFQTLAANQQSNAMTIEIFGDDNFP